MGRDTRPTFRFLANLSLTEGEANVFTQHASASSKPREYTLWRHIERGCSGVRVILVA